MKSRGNVRIEVVAMSGRHPGHTEAFAARWVVPAGFTDTELFFDQPLGRTVGEAQEMAEESVLRETIAAVPFTYRHMPLTLWLKRLIDDRYVGKPHHLGMRYSTAYARGGEYSCRFDVTRAGSGVIGEFINAVRSHVPCATANGAMRPL